jgi:hypothetical protein
MLDIATKYTPMMARPQTRVRQIQTISGQNITKAKHSPAMRAYFGATWVRGLLDIEDRTGALAAAIFSASQSAISREIAENDDDPVTTTEMLVHHWHRASDSERAEFARAVGVSAVWDDAIVPNI